MADAGRVSQGDGDLSPVPRVDVLRRVQAAAGDPLPDPFGVVLVGVQYQHRIAASLLDQLLQGVQLDRMELMCSAVHVIDGAVGELQELVGQCGSCAGHDLLTLQDLQHGILLELLIFCQQLLGRRQHDVLVDLARQLQHVLLADAHAQVGQLVVDLTLSSFAGSVAVNDVPVHLLGHQVLRPEGTQSLAQAFALIQ